MPSQNAFSTLTGKMSVSGYIRAAPGRGLMYAVEPSSSILLVSSGTPASAIPARRITCLAAHFASSPVPATRTTASSSPAPAFSRTDSTSSAVIP